MASREHASTPQQEPRSAQTQWEPPERQAFIREVQAMPAEQQVSALRPPEPWSHVSSAALAASGAPPGDAVQMRGGTGSGGGDPAWDQFFQQLPRELKGPAGQIEDPKVRQAMMGMNTFQLTVFLTKLSHSLVKKNFAERAGTPRTKICNMTVDQKHLDFFEYLHTGPPAQCREPYQMMTPDEWDELTAMEAADAVDILKKDTALAEWRNARNSEALKTQTTLTARLVTRLGNPNEIGELLVQLSEGEAGERLRRIILDQAFEVLNDKIDYIMGVRDLVVNNKKKPIDAMWDLKPNYVLKGKPTKPDWDVPVSKAIPLTWLVLYGQPLPHLIKRILDANITHPECPKKSEPGRDGKPQVDISKWSSLDQGVRSDMAIKYFQTGGPFNPKADIGSFAVRSGVPLAYWMFDKDQHTAALAAKSKQEIIEALAIEETPDYQYGLVYVSLTKWGRERVEDAAQAGGPQMRRPTAIDGLGFDQFKLVMDNTVTFGLTSGGTGEVVVGTVDLHELEIERIIR
jgi:hypothetical protein